jgi:hypothetical protein
VCGACWQGVAEVEFEELKRTSRLKTVAVLLPPGSDRHIEFERIGGEDVYNIIDKNGK